MSPEVVRPLIEDSKELYYFSIILSSQTPFDRDAFELLAKEVGFNRKGVYILKYIVRGDEMFLFSYIGSHVKYDDFLLERGITGQLQSAGSVTLGVDERIIMSGSAGLNLSARLSFANAKKYTKEVIAPLLSGEFTIKHAI